jgi:hypothetical protein
MQKRVTIAIIIIALRHLDESRPAFFLWCARALSIATQTGRGLRPSSVLEAPVTVSFQAS